MNPNFSTTKFYARVTRNFFTGLLFLLTPSRTHAQIHNWTKINTGYLLSSGIRCFAVTPKCLYVFNGNYSTLIRSTDDGLSWDSLYVPSDSSDHEYTDMRFVNDSVGYIIGHDGSHHSTSSSETSVVKKTINRGQTWQTMRTGIVDNSLLLHINFFDANTGFVFGTGNFATHRFRTTNAALTWTYVPDSPSPNAQIDMPQVGCSSFTGGQHAFVSGVGMSANGRIAGSHDGGQTWNTVRINASHPSGMRFFNGNDGIVVVNDSIFVTNNSATSFSARRKFPHANYIRSFEMISMQKGFFCSPTNIYYTADAGITWSLSYSGTSQIESIRISGNHVYASTFNDSLVLKLDISGLVSIAENKGERSVIPVFPNPASEKVRIGLPGTIKIEEAQLTDQLGKFTQVVKVADDQTVDISGFAPGVYLLTVFAKELRYTAKLVIVE